MLDFLSILIFTISSIVSAKIATIFSIVAAEAVKGRCEVDARVD